MNALPPALWSTQWQGVEIVVFTTGDDSLLSLADAAEVLNAEDHARAGRFHFDADRERWMRSRALLRMRLAERTGREEVAFRPGVNGKPELETCHEGRHPSLHFNLSHSGDFAAIAIGDAAVGVDIEQWRNDLPVADLAVHEFRHDESAAILESAEPHLLFYRLWTAKEAVMKCTGLGLSLAPASIQVIAGSQGFPFRATRLDSNEAFELLSHEVPGEWVLTATRQSS